MTDPTAVADNTAARPVDRETIQRLIAKYDRPGPRYTSYPTAVEFDEGFTADDYKGRLLEADTLAEAPLSVYMHLPFCEERCLFCGCHVIVTKHRKRAASYLDVLRREMVLIADQLPNRRTFSQLHLGGGTPTYYSPRQLASLVKSFLSVYTPAPDAELAVEVDPRVTTNEHIDALAHLGFNRMSMGVQDFTPAVQERVHRVQSVEQTARVIRRARAQGYSGINIDLIYGLPLQTPRTFEDTVATVIELGADRVAVYSFAYVPWIRGHQKKLDAHELPSRETKMELFAIARERFLQAGYEPIGMDHFARPDDELALAKQEGRLQRNFQGYAVRTGDDTIGFGISAIGDVRGAYVQNVKKLSTYARAIEEGRLPVDRGLPRTGDDDLRRHVIQMFMCNFVIDARAVEHDFGIDFADYFATDLDLLRGYEREDLVSLSAERIQATPVGELFIRNLAMCFDRYVREKHADDSSPIFSRTV